MSTIVNAHLVEAAGNTAQATVDLYIDNMPKQETVSSATKSKAGIVKQAVIADDADAAAIVKALKAAGIAV